MSRLLHSTESTVSTFGTPYGVVGNLGYLLLSIQCQQLESNI